MTRHLFRLIWNRKRSNFLIMLEILCAFLVLEGVVLMASHYVNNYRKPLGFVIDQTWTVNIDTKQQTDDKVQRAAQMVIVRELFNVIRDVPEVEVACAGFTAPYGNAGWGGSFKTNGRTIDHGVNKVTDDCDKVLGITLLGGRWFSKEDDGAGYTPVILNRQLATSVFGESVDPVGKTIPVDRNEVEEKLRIEAGDPPPKPMRVIGYLEDFRQDGEYSTPVAYMFQREDLNAAAARPPNQFMIKVRAGTPASFEEALVKRLQETARDWSFGVRQVVNTRDDKLRQYVIPLTMFAVVAGFLLLMVGLGLTGVVWQNVTQRIREIGLRRAKGARIENIHQQILGELVVMTSVALLVGVILLVQVPLLPIPRDFRIIPAGVFVTSIVLSMVFIYILTIACGWYPARLATKIQPAEALHYE
jgi:putative ABC transport system permease protein